MRRFYLPPSVWDIYALLSRLRVALRPAPGPVPHLAVTTHALHHLSYYHADDLHANQGIFLVLTVMFHAASALQRDTRQRNRPLMERGGFF